MAALDPAKSRVMETCAAFVIVGFTGMMAFITIAPYFGLTPISSSDAAIIAQHQTTIQNVTLAIISFLFGASVGSKTKDDTISTLSSTAAVAQAAATPGPTIPLAPGDKVTVSADPNAGN